MSDVNLDPRVRDRDDDDALLRARTLIERAIRRRWNEGLLTRDPDGVFTAFLGADHVERLLQPKTQAAGPVQEDHAYPPQSALGLLTSRLRLSPPETDLLAVLLSCETDPTTARLMNYLGGNQAQFVVTVDLVFEVVFRARSPHQSEAAALLQRCLSPAGQLQRLQLVTLDGPEGRVALAQAIRIHPRLCAWLLSQPRHAPSRGPGGAGLAPDLSAVAVLRAPDAARGEFNVADLQEAVAAFTARQRLLLLEGPPQSGREMLVHFAAARLQRPLLVVSGAGLGAARLPAVFREASLHGALLVLREADEVLEGEGLLRLRECLEVFLDTVALIGVARSTPRLIGIRPTSTITINVPPHEDRYQLWRRYLGVELPLDPSADLVESQDPSVPIADTALCDDDLRQIASLYNLGTSGVIHASAAAREMATFAGVPMGRVHVTQAVRQLFDNDLSNVARRSEVSQRWEDLVLPEDVAQSIESLIDRIRFRSEIMGGWGFARKLGKGLGLTALFAGEPGTGKSMAAGLIASELGLDLYIIDLSRVMSKWLGETEKNLARAFDAAEAGHVLLLFDEADTILGKRSGDIRSSNDRHANLETNYILARLEQFQGLAFFTTNLMSAIDPAMLRRMSAQVHFPFPDVPTRAELWRRMIPEEVPQTGVIDFHRLAERYEVTGGFIRNIVLRAAFTAIREGGGLAMKHLIRAAELEYRERGSLLSGGRLV